MKGKDELAAACRQNDERMDSHPPGEGSPMPALFRDLGMDADAAFHVAEQRAMRLLAHISGRDPREFTRADLEASADFMSYAGAAFADGLAAGLAVAQITPEQLAQAMMLPLYDALAGRPIVVRGAEEEIELGSFTDEGDKQRLELAKLIVDRLGDVLPPSDG